MLYQINAAKAGRRLRRNEKRREKMSVENMRSVMHIDPKRDVLYSIPDSDNHGDLLIRPQGNRMINELGDTIYIKDAFVPYHDHEKGYETFLIDGGSAEVCINKKKCIIKRGDIVHIRPYVNHGYRYLEENTIWREMFQEMDMYNCVEDKHVIRTYSPEYWEDEEFKARRYKILGTLYREDPVPVPAKNTEIPAIRPRGTALASFDLGIMKCNLKVGRWETEGAKEIWEFLPEKGTQIEWNYPYAANDVYLVMEGSVHVQADGHDFVSKKRDIINVPPYYKHTFTVLEEGTQLYAYNVQSYLMHIMERIHAEKVRTPEHLEDWAYVEKILRDNNCWVTGFRKVTV